MNWHCVVGLGMALLLGGCSGKKDPDSKGGDHNSPITLTVAEFEAAYKQDPSAAREKYRDRTVELTGVVTRAGIGTRKQQYLTLGEKTGCRTLEPMPWTKAAPGQTVKVRGKGPEKTPGPQLVDCEILEVSGNGPPSFTPEQFAKECAADLKAAQAKYKDKFVQINGEIDEIKFNDIKQGKVTFKSAGNPRIRIDFEPYHEATLRPLMKGQAFKAYGQFNPTFTGEEQILLLWGLPLK